ncbi:MAG TPA: hypothetical protein VNC19_08510 [Gemmatimonadales bacterium]|nr:hypothetical protein [Gemmatimonadales bacterium]
MAACRAHRQQSCSALILLVALVAACGAEEQPRSQDTATSSVPDSLVATGKDGLQVWFTLTRVGLAPDGTSCVERGLEIRRRDTRIQVPLLYTGAAPVLLDQSTMRAELWNHCRPVGTYLVDLRSGRPVREHAGGTA